MPRNSDAYSLLILDEHLWRWIDACNYSDSLIAAPEREEFQVLLKRLLAVWPVLLKLLNAAQNSRRPPLWLPYVIRSADRLILAARDIPMKAIRYHVEELLTKVQEIEGKANQLVEIQVEKERLVFLSNYSSVCSEYHNATEYWPMWEPQVRTEAMNIVRAKLDEFQGLLTERRRELEKMHLEQISIRDRWMEMRLRLNPERYEDTNAWWGSVIRPMRPDLSADILGGIPEFVTISERLMTQLHPSNLIETSRALSKIHLSTSASVGVVADPPAQIPWTILRSTCLDLLKELSQVIMKKKRSSAIVLASLNMVDILLRLLYCHDLTQFDDEEQAMSAEIVKARGDAAALAKQAVNPSLDPVVAKFNADGKGECMQAAITRLMEGTRVRSQKEREEKAEVVLKLQAKLSALQAYRQTTFEVPWETVWAGWTKVIGPDGDGPMAEKNPPPLKYSS